MGMGWTLLLIISTMFAMKLKGRSSAEYDNGEEMMEVERKGGMTELSQ